MMHRANFIRFELLIAVAILLGGCDEEPSPTPAPADHARVDRTIWQTRPDVAGERAVESTGAVDPAAQIAVIDRPLEQQLQESLREAVSRARATVDEARERWQGAPSHERSRWAVKWAAPLTPDDAVDAAGTAGVEYVWVRPVHWSPFRIEGILVSDPVHELGAGRERGGLVSFPIEELVDWVRFHTDDPTGPRDGGFTMDALDRAAPIEQAP